MDDARKTTPRSARWRGVLLGLLLILLVGPPSAPAHAHAATLQVSTTADSGAGSLRQAIATAAAGDTITFAPTVSGTILLTSGELPIDKSLTIAGPGAGQLTVSGNNTSRVVNITAGTVALSGLTIAQGRSATYRFAHGGGVRITGGTVRLTDMIIADNNAQRMAGGLYIADSTVTLLRTTVRDNVADSQTDRVFGGGIAIASGSLTLIDSLVRGNRSQWTGTNANGSSGYNGDGGGIYANDATVSLLRTTVRDNVASGNGPSGSRGGGINSEFATLILRDSTVSGNSASSDVGGSRGGGLYIDGGTATITDTTIADNLATSVAATDLGTNYGGGLVLSGATVTIDNSAITGNSARGTGSSRYGFGGGLAISGGPGTQSIALTNTTISGNATDTSGGGFSLTYASRTTVNLAFVTLTANIADADQNGTGDGGGFFTDNSATDSAIAFHGSIVAGNSDRGGEQPDCAGRSTSRTDNLFGDRTSCPASTFDLDLATLGVGIGAVLVPTLADNGATTRTHALPPGSPAADAIQFADRCPAHDQRGVARPQGQRCDIGAYEAVVTPAPWSGSPITGAITGGDPTQSGRLSRNGVVSACDSPKPLPERAQDSGAHRYDAYHYTNTSARTICLRVKLASASCLDASAVASVAYLGAFNPANLANNYLADSGFSPPPDRSYAFLLGAGETAVIIVHGILPDTVCASYTLSAGIEQTIAFATPGDSTYGAAPTILQATGGASGQPVTFATTTPTVCATGGAHGASLTTLGAGLCTVRASQLGDATHAAATTVERSFTVAQVPQAITFGTLADHTHGEAPFTIDVTASSGLPVTLSSVGPCTVNGAHITSTGVGRCILTANQAGDGNYLPAPPSSGSFTIHMPPSPSPSSSPAQPYTVTASHSGGGTLTPAGTTSHAANTQATYTATADAGQVFIGWTLDGLYVGYASPLTFAVASDRVIVARFVPRPTFNDLDGLSAADQQAITFLAALGIVNPTGVNNSGNFEPDRPVKRAEIAALVARAFGWQREFHANPFPDRCDPTGSAGCVDDDLWNAIAALRDYGVVGGYTDPATCDAAQTTAPCYLPRDVVQRVQVVSIVARAFTKNPGLRPTAPWDRLDPDPAHYTNVPDLGTQRSDLTTYLANALALPDQTDTATFTDPAGNGLRRFVIAVLYQALDTEHGTDRVP